jgi:hypothetical protein
MEDQVGLEGLIFLVSYQANAHYPKDQVSKDVQNDDSHRNLYDDRGCPNDGV